MLDRAVAVWAACLACALANCGKGTSCDEALDKMVGECQLGSGAKLPLGGDHQECVDQTECGADCVNDADCDEIIEPLDATNPNAYYKCLGTCPP